MVSLKEEGWKGRVKACQFPCMALILFFHCFRPLLSIFLTEHLSDSELIADAATADKMDTAPFLMELTA